MRALRINRDLTIDEIETPMEDWFGEGIMFDATDIDDKHDVYFDDEGMLKADTVVVRVAGTRVPLPAFVVGYKGEDTVAAVMSVEELRAMVT